MQPGGFVTVQINLVVHDMFLLLHGAQGLAVRPALRYDWTLQVSDFLLYSA